MLGGKQGVLGAAQIVMGSGGAIQWSQDKIGCIAVAPFMRRGATVNPASPERLPPPPPQPAPTHPPMTLQQAGVKMDGAKRSELSALAKERDEQRTKGNTSLEAWRGLLDRA